MLDKFLALLERFVVAHELIAVNTGELARKKTDAEIEQHAALKELTEKSQEQAAKPKAKPEEDDLSDDEPEEKPKTRKPRATKPKAEPEPDLDKLREEIEVMAKHIGSGDSDDCADELDDLLHEYDARSVKKLKDLHVQEFHKELKAIVAKYYDIEE